MTDTLTVLGSTGSVGTQALDVARQMNIRVKALAACSDVLTMERQAREFKVDLCALSDESAAADLRVRLADTDIKVTGGADAATELAALQGVGTVLNAVSGVRGLRPTLAALSSSARLALANKESLVTAGELVMRTAKEHHAEILPVDSEHCAIFQCLLGSDRRSLKRIVLTASGGPFFGYDKEMLSTVTLAQTLAHPTWKMGRRITVDSATLMNKGFEIIEAARLYSVPVESVDVVIHRESIIHSMVEFNDNAVIAQMSVPDMRLCVQYALTHPHRTDAVIEQLDLIKTARLTFFEPDNDSFPLLALAKEAYNRGGNAGAVMNAADEVAVELFLAGKIGFAQIAPLVTYITRNYSGEGSTLGQIEDADAFAREETRSAANRKSVY